MQSDYLQNVNYKIDNNHLWKRLEQLYNDYYYNYSGDYTPKIPKKLHHVWLGGRLPDKYKWMVDTWRNCHPDWEYKLWGDEDAENFPMINRGAFNIIKNKGAKSDILRYEILYQHGGIYMDTDFICVKPFDDFLHLDFFGGSGHTANPCAFNGLFGCTPNHEVLRKVIDVISRKDIKEDYRLNEIMWVTGPDCFSKEVMSYVEGTKDKAVIFPTNFFYPMPNTFRLEIREDNEANRRRVYSYIKPKTYCIHLWYTAWQT
jgi:mannosyltransferase OCH1-like enzyme